MRYFKSRSRISKRRKMFSDRGQILMKRVLTSDEILELFGNKDKIIESEVVINDNHLHAYFLLRGNFFVNKGELARINAKLPDYIPHEERDNLLLGLAGIIENIDARNHDVVEVIFEYTNESDINEVQPDSKMTSIDRTKHFIAEPIYTRYMAYYYNIEMIGYTGYEVLRGKVTYEKKRTILAMYKVPHYDLPVCIKFIGEALERAR